MLWIWSYRVVESAYVNKKTLLTFIRLWKISPSVSLKTIHRLFFQASWPLCSSQRELGYFLGNRTDVITLSTAMTLSSLPAGRWKAFEAGGRAIAMPDKKGIFRFCVTNLTKI